MSCCLTGLVGQSTIGRSIWRLSNVKRGRSTGKPTKEQQARFDAIKEIGCIIARIRGAGFVPCDIHHLTIGGKHGQKRRGHEFTIGLSPWSHRGYPSGGLSAEGSRQVFGPSYALQPRAFRETFGSDDVLLEYQNKLIAELVNANA